MENFDINLYGKDYLIDFDYETETDNDSFDHEFGTENIKDYKFISSITINEISDEYGVDVTHRFNKKYVEEILLVKHQEEILKSE